MPYVYRAFDRAGALLYIGRAKNWGSRWAGHSAVLLADVVVHADDPALEDREVALGGVRMCIASDVLAALVIHGLVARKFLVESLVGERGAGS